MPKLNTKLKLLKQILYQLADSIDADNCHSDEDSIDEAIDAINKLNKGIPRISKTEACEKILYCSSRTFENYLQLGIIPPGRKTPHFKELSWAERDFDKAKEYRRTHL